MPFEIVRNDIVNMRVDAIVNSANPRPVVGLGTDSRIHGAAGPGLLAARQKIGNIAAGQAAITPAFDLHAKYVIHTVGPVWDGGGYGEEALLRSCYDNSLALALKNGCGSIAFPLIATHNYGFPKDKALQIAVAAFSQFLLEHDMLIYLVVFDRSAYKLSEKLFHSVSSYIDDRYVAAWEEAVYDGAEPEEARRNRRRRDIASSRSTSVCEDRALLPQMLAPMAQPMAVPAQKPKSLKDFLKKADAGFTETLLKLIDQSGKKDSEIYKRANITKQHFSKIRNNFDYRPNKATALALAVALELSIEQTKDLIGRAGYALTNSSKQDLIVMYYLENKNYNVIEINMTLYEFDQGLLGSS